MSLSSGLDNSLNIVDAAATVLTSGATKQAFDRGGKFITNTGIVMNRLDRMNRAGSSLSSITNQTTIPSRAFIEESLLNEPVLGNVMQKLHEYYVAQVISALKLTQLVNAKQTVADVMSVVQTGHTARRKGTFGNLVDHVNAKFAGMESFLAGYLGTEALEGHDPQDPFVLVTHQELKDVNKERDDAVSKLEELKRKENNVSVHSVSTSDHRMGPIGELYEIKLDNPTGNGQSITIPVFIQMAPSIIPDSIAPRFVDMAVTPTVWQRWTQMTAGEISFWKDFIFQVDLFKRQLSVIKDPVKAKAFSEYLRTTAKKDTYALAESTSSSNINHASANLANSVMVLSEETVAQAKVDSGIDLHREADRVRYFKSAYAMILVIMDPIHQRLTIYFNGVDGALECAYGEFKGKDSGKFDPKDFMMALQAFSTNSIGRMR